MVRYLRFRVGGISVVKSLDAKTPVQMVVVALRHYWK